MLHGLIFMAEDSTSYTPIPVSTGTSQDVLDYEYQQGEKAKQYLNAITGITGNLDRSAGEVALDTGKNVVAGALTGATDSAAFLAGLAGLNSLSRGIASVSDYIEKGAQNLGSRGEQAQRAWYQLKQAEDAEKAQNEFYADIASGKKSTLEATAAREAKNFLSATKNAFSTGYAGEVIASGLGSMGSDILLSGGMSAAAKTATKMLPGISKGAKALAETNKFTQGVAKNAPWMAAVGLEEGGNQYRQQLNDALEMDTAKLLATSPEFKARVEERLSRLSLEQRSNPEVVQNVINQVKNELAADAARDAGLKTAGLAMALSPLTKWAQRPFEIGGRSAKKLLGEAVTEPAEETITEGGGQIASNMATQKYLDPSQDLGEKAGESGSLGGIGGLGMTAVRGTPAVAAGAIGSGIRTGIDLVSHNPDRRAKQISQLGEQYKDTLTGSGLDVAGEQVGKVYEKIHSYGKNLKDASLDELNQMEKDLGSVSEGISKVSNDFFAEETRTTAQKYAQQIQEQTQDLAKKIQQARTLKYSELEARIKKNPSNLQDTDVEDMEAYLKDASMRTGQTDTTALRNAFKSKVGEKVFNAYEQKLQEINVRKQSEARDKFIRDEEGLKNGELTFERMLDMDKQARSQGIDFANKDYSSDSPADKTLSSQASRLPYQFQSAAQKQVAAINSAPDEQSRNNAIAKSAWLFSRSNGTVEDKQKAVFSIFDTFAKNDDFIDKSNVPMGVKQELRDLYTKYEASKQPQPQPKPVPTPTLSPVQTPQEPSKESVAGDEKSIYGSPDDVAGRSPKGYNWKEYSGDTMVVGGTTHGYKSKYPEGILTRPGTHPDTWNGQKISEIKDPDGNAAIGKFYSPEGSEYVYSNGYTRRVKFVDTATDGEDAGVASWHKAYFIPKNHPIYDLLTGAKHYALYEDFYGHHLDTKTGKFQIKLQDGTWKNLTYEDVAKTAVAKGLLPSGEYPAIPLNQRIPKLGYALLEFKDNPDGSISWNHIGNGPAYIEKPISSKSTSKSSPSPAPAQPTETKATQPQSQEPSIMAWNIQDIKAESAKLGNATTKEATVPNLGKVVFSKVGVFIPTPEDPNKYLKLADLGPGAPELAEQLMQQYAPEFLSQPIPQPKVEKPTQKEPEITEQPTSEKKTEGQEPIDTKAPDVGFIRDEQGNVLVNDGKGSSVPLEIAYPYASNAQIKEAEKVFADPTSTLDAQKQALEKLEQASKKASEEKQVNLRDKDLKLTKCSDEQLLYVAFDEINPHRDDALELLKHRKVIIVLDPNGEVSTERTNVVDSEYAQKMLGSLTDRFIPISRAIHLMRGQPLKMLNTLIEKPENILKVLQDNNAISANALYKRLQANDGELLKELKHWFDPENFFVKELTEGISKRLSEYSEFADTDKNKLTQIGVIAAAHILATTAVMQQQNLMPVLERYGFKSDEGTQPNLDTIEGGYLLQALADNAQTTIRKFMGVGISEEANLEKANKFLAQSAQAVLETLVEKGYLETFDVGLNKDIINDSGYRETVEQPTKFVRPTEDFAGKHRIFKREAGILEAILDSNFKNIIHTSIPGIAGMIANTSQVITPEQAYQLQAYNKVPYEVNSKLWKLQSELGADGIYSLFNEQVTNADMPYRNAKDFMSAKGKKLSYDQSVTYVDAAKEAGSKVFFRNVILRNARAMQQGSVTPQNNKHCRAFMSPIHDKMDISNQNSDMYKFWTLGLAQKWGAKTNGMDKAIWSAKVTKFAKEVLEPNSKKFRQLYSITREENATPFSATLKNALGLQEVGIEDKALTIKQAIAEFNKLSEDFQVSDLEGLNALIEMLEYLNDEPGRKSFNSDVFIEIDGINDGPHHISAFYGAIFENFNAESLKRLTQTGIYTGVEANATIINDPDLLDDEVWEERKKLLTPEDITRIEAEREHVHKFWGATGQDFHRQVAEKAIPKYICSRIIALNNTNNGSNKMLGKKALRAALTLLKATGYLKTNLSIREITDMKEEPKDGNYGFTFSRDISKKLTTIIPYGSQPKGSMRQIIDMIFTGYKNNPGIYSMISKKLAERTDTKVDKYRMQYLGNFKQTFLKGKSFIIDTETTGLDTAKNKVVQIALQEVNDGARKGKPIIIYINTDEHGQQIPEKLNGEINPLIEAYAKNKDKALSAKEAGEKLQQILGDAPIFGHNINGYDIAILRQHLGIPLNNKSYDSLELARILRPGQEASLQKLAQAFNLTVEGNAHLADSDINTNFSVISELIDRASDELSPKLTLDATSVESTDDFNGVEWTDVSDAVNTLGGMNYIRTTGEYRQVAEEERASRVKHFVKKFPAAEELLSIAKPFVVVGKKIYQKLGVDKDGKDIRNEDIPQNAEVTSKGLDNMAKVLEATIGEPAQAGVEEVLGQSAMRTERVSMAIGQIVSLVAREVEKALGRPKTMKEAVRYRQFLNSVSGTLDINGTRAFIEKTGYNADSQPLAESKLLGIKFFSMLSHITDAGVAGGALSIQAAGDATMVRILANLLSAIENFSFKHIFDGLDTHVSKLGKVEKVANMASAKTVEASLLASVQDMLLNCGKNLMKIDRLGIKSTDPYEAIKEILAKAIQDDTDGEQVAYNILRANNSLQQDIKWLPDPVSSVNRRRENNKETRVMSHMGHRKAQVEQALNQIFSTTKVLVASEASAKAVDKMVPISVNHMCAVGIPYSQRGVLNDEEANKLLDDVKAAGIQGINTIIELMAAYKATLRTQADITEKVTKGLTDEEKEQYNSLMNSFPDKHATNILPPKVMDIVSKALGTKISQTKEQLYKETQTFQTSALVASLTSRAKKHAGERTTDVKKAQYDAWASVFDRVAQLLPDTIKRSSINFVASIEDLPEEVQAHFDKTTKGYCDLETGKIWIIADPEKGVMSLSRKDKQVLLHELIHATVALHVNKYYGLEIGKDVTVSKAQEMALKNLDTLLDRFTEADLTGYSKYLIKFQDYLKNGIEGAPIDKTPAGKARRMNEALAYILAEEPLLNEMACVEFDTKVLRKNTSHLYKLIQAISKSAKNVLRVIFRILPASIVSNYQAQYAYGEVKNKSVEIKALDFMGLFGLNTRVFLGEGTDTFTPPKGGKKVESKINSDVKGLAYIDLAHESEFKNKLQDDIINAVNAEYRANPKYTKAAVDSKIVERLKDVRNYANSLEANLSLGITRANKVADLAVTLMEPHFLNAHDRDVLTKGYLEIKDKLPKHFLVKDPSTASKEELEASERVHGMLTGILKTPWNTPGSKKPIGLVLDFEAPALFYAMAKEHPEFFGALGEIFIKPEERKATAGEGAFKKAIETIAVKARNYMEGALKEKSATSFIDRKLQEEGDLFNRKNVTFFDRLHNWAQSIDRFLNEKFHYIISKGLFALNRDSIPETLLQQLTKEAAQMPVSHHQMVTDFLAFLNNTLVKNQDLNTTIAELFGRTTNNRAIQAFLKKVKGNLDKGRSAYLERLPEIIEQSFKRKLADKDRMYLSRVLGSYDIKVFGGDFNELSSLLTDEQAIQTKWDSLKKALENKYGTLSNKMIQKVEQFGNWKAGDRNSGHALLTNPEAILSLLTTEDADSSRVKNTESLKLIDQLMTLACLKRMSKGDRAVAKDFLTKEKRGIVTLVAWLEASKQHEQKRLAATARQETLEKTSRNASYRFNYIKGWAPVGNRPRGLYRLVPQKDVNAFKAEGYQVLGNYSGSELDTEPMIRMWNPNPYSNDLQEGILQSITQTGFGYQIENGTRGEALGTRILDSDTATGIFHSYDLERTKNGVIPVFDSEGNTIGYERSIPPEDRQKVEEHTDIISGLGQWYVRQEREEQAGSINQELVDILATMWHSAKNIEKNEFVDVFASTDPHIQKALKRFDQKTLDRIHRAFGNHFWVRRDSVAATIGYYSASPVDLWDSNFFLPKQVQEGIVKVLEGILGPKAKYYVGKGFDITRGIVSTLRDTIVIRSVVVPVANIVSNVFNLHFGLGVPIADIIRLSKESIVATEIYSRLYNKRIDLEASLIMPGADREKIQHQINNINTRIQNLSVYSLIDAGEFSTISSQGRIFEDVEFLKQSRADMIDYISSKIPKPMQTLTSNMLLTKNSELYQALTKMVNYGDWIAKCVGYRYLTEKSGTRDTYFSANKATDIVSTMFVDYDQFMGRGRRFLNDIGFSMFFSFMYRMIPAAFLSMLMNPFKTLVGTALGKFTGVGTPLLDNWVFRLFNGNLTSSLMWGTLMRAWTLHPLAFIIR